MNPISIRGLRKITAEDDAALVAMGVDPTEWSVEAVRALKNE